MTTHQHNHPVCECGQPKSPGTQGCLRCLSLEHATAGRSNKKLVVRRMEQMHLKRLGRECDVFLRSRGLVGVTRF